MKKLLTLIIVFFIIISVFQGEIKALKPKIEQKYNIKLNNELFKSVIPHVKEEYKKYFKDENIYDDLITSPCFIRTKDLKTVTIDEIESEKNLKKKLSSKINENYIIEKANFKLKEEDKYEWNITLKDMKGKESNLIMNLSYYDLFRKVVIDKSDLNQKEYKKIPLILIENAQTYVVIIVPVKYSMDIYNMK